MFYYLKRAVFVHIPKTGGNSITAAFASAADFETGATVCSYGAGDVYKHMPAHQIRKALGVDAWRACFRFAIQRPIDERRDSFRRMIQRDQRAGVATIPHLCDQYRAVLRMTPEQIESYLDRMVMPTKHYTHGRDGEPLGVHVYRYAELAERWPELCDRIGIDRVPLPRLNAG